MSSIKKNITQTLKTVIFAFLLIAGVNYAFAVDWTPPTATPPSGNTSAPVNVSANGQLKDGALYVNVARTNSQFSFGVSSQTNPLAFYVQSDGNVGIGSGVQATAALDVGGQIKMRGGTPGVGKVLTSDINGLGSWQTPAAGGNAFWTAGTAANTITNSNTGNVGIGTTNPSAKLEVKGTSNQYIKLTSTASNVDIASQYTDAANNVSVFSGLLGAAAGAGKWGVYNGATRMVVDNAGNVGIGTTNPVNKLHVMGGAYMQGNVSIGGSVNPTKMLEVGGNTSINGTLRIGEVSGASTPAAGRVLTSIDTSGNASWRAGVESGFIYSTFAPPYGSGASCGVTPNKTFVVSAMGRVRPGGGGAGNSQVSFSINGVLFQDVFSSNGYDGPFALQRPVNSDANGCITVVNGGSLFAPNYLTVSFVG